MKRFSIVEIQGKVTLFCGVVDNYTLSEYKPLLDLLSTLEVSEVVRVNYSICLVDDSSGNDRDLNSSELEWLEEHFKEYADKGLVQVIEQGYFEEHGVLDKPFEDFYGLEGEDRKKYLDAKAEFKKTQQKLAEALSSEGLSEEEVQTYLKTC